MMNASKSEIALWAETLKNILAAEKAVSDARIATFANRDNADKEQEYRNARENLKDELYCRSHIIVAALRHATREPQ